MERESMWSENEETDRKRRKRGREEGIEKERVSDGERGRRGAGVNYDQGPVSTHLARCFISSPRTCRFLSGSLWTRQWTAWMRDSGLPPSVQTHREATHWRSTTRSCRLLAAMATGQLRCNKAPRGISTLLMIHMMMMMSNMRWEYRESGVT